MKIFNLVLTLISLYLLWIRNCGKYSFKCERVLALLPKPLCFTKIFRYLPFLFHKYFFRNDMIPNLDIE